MPTVREISARRGPAIARSSHEAELSQCFSWSGSQRGKRRAELNEPALGVARPVRRTSTSSGTPTCISCSRSLPATSISAVRESIRAQRSDEDVAIASSSSIIRSAAENAVMAGLESFQNRLAFNQVYCAVKLLTWVIEPSRFGIVAPRFFRKSLSKFGRVAVSGVFTMSTNDPAPSLAPRTFRFSDVDEFRSSVRTLDVSFTPLVRRIAAEQTILQLPGFDVNFPKSFPRVIDAQLAPDCTAISFLMDDEDRGSIRFNRMQEDRSAIVIGGGGTAYSAVELAARQKRTPQSCSGRGRGSRLARQPWQLCRVRDPVGPRCSGCGIWCRKCSPPAAAFGRCRGCKDDSLGHAGIPAEPAQMPPSPASFRRVGRCASMTAGNSKSFRMSGPFSTRTSANPSTARTSRRSSGCPSGRCTTRFCAIAG